MMYGENNGSREILKYIKGGTIGAEIGVWKGSTSQHLVTKNLKELHLIDPYALPSDSIAKADMIKRYAPMIGGDKEEDFVAYYDGVHKSIVEMFKNHNEVTVHRMASEEWFAQVEDNTFDWIYVDGDHTFEGCYLDLVGAAKKIKSGGVMLGDDYKSLQWKGKEGVVQAVDKFTALNPQHKFIMLDKGQFKYEIA
jgi:hypothetical protein